MKKVFISIFAYQTQEALLLLCYHGYSMTELDKNPSYGVTPHLTGQAQQY